MSAEETILFAAVIVLAVALVGVVVGPKLRASRLRRAERAGQPEPGASAAAPSGPAEIGAQEPVALPEPPVAASARPPAPTPPQAWGPLVCPTCRRQFAGGLRFCPYDARLLSAAEPPAAPGGGERESSTDANLSAPVGKICPTCSRRYEIGAVVCARDGAPLVSVN